MKLNPMDFDESRKIFANHLLYKDGKLYSEWAHQLMIHLQCTKDKTGRYVNTAHVHEFAISVLNFHYFNKSKDLFYYFALTYIERYFINEDKRVVIHLLAIEKYNETL